MNMKEQDKQAWQNAEIQVLSNDEMNRIITKMDTVEQMPVSQVATVVEPVPANDLHVKHTNGIIGLASLALVAILIYTIYEIRSVIKIGKLIEKEWKK